VYLDRRLSSCWTAPELSKRQLPFRNKDSASNESHEKLRPYRSSGYDSHNRFTICDRLLNNRKNERVDDAEHHSGSQPGALCHPYANGKREDSYGQEHRRSLDPVLGKVKQKRCNKAKAIGSQTPEIDPQFRAGRVLRFSLICQVDTRQLGRRKLRYEFNAVQRLHVGAWIELLIGKDGEIGKIAFYELSHEAPDIHWRKYDGRQAMRGDIADERRS
jgi:hypothetical protein